MNAKPTPPPRSVVYVIKDKKPPRKEPTKPPRYIDTAFEGDMKRVLEKMDTIQDLLRQVIELQQQNPITEVREIVRQTTDDSTFEAEPSPRQEVIWTMKDESDGEETEDQEASNDTQAIEYLIEEKNLTADEPEWYNAEFSMPKEIKEVKVLPLQPPQQKVARRLNLIEDANKGVFDTYDIAPYEFQGETKIKFPIRSEEALEFFDLKLKTDSKLNLKFQSYVCGLFKTEGCNLAKTVSKIVADDIFRSYNFSGVKNRRCLKNLLLFQEIFYDNCHQGTYENYLSELKKLNLKAMNRIHKRASIKRKSMQLEEYRKTIQVMNM